MAEIYALKDPTTLEVRYIGKANDSIKRFRKHISDAKRRSYPVYRWINKLMSKGMVPVLEVLLITNDWVADEVTMIKEYKDKGCKLLNIALGGNMPYCSPEQREINGRNIVKNIKNKRLWMLKKEFGQYLSRMKSTGNVSQYNYFIDKIKSVSKQTNAFDCFLHLERI